MSKVDIDTDKISNDLIPLAREQYGKIVSARGNASKVSIPNDAYDWGSVYSKIDDCVSQSDKYLKWIESINTSYVNDITNKVDDINNIQIENISKYV